MRGLCILLPLLMAQNCYGMLDYFNVERCSAGGELMELNTKPGPHTLIFHEITFACEGKVAFWEFNSNRNNGKFFATVWRTDRVTGELILVGKNEIRVNGTGYQEYEVPKTDRIRVNSGDMIGLHYPRFNNNWKGLINIEVPPDIGTPTHQVGTLVSNYSSFEMNNRQLRRGIRLRGEANKPGKPALRGRVHNVHPFLRLANGQTVHEGRAEVFEEGTWGTICDKWFENRGWPLVFCCEMGFPNVTSVVKYAREAAEAFDATRLVPIPPIHMQSPKCKLSQNISFFNCEIHPKGDCDHDLDVIIRCAARVRLVHPLLQHVGHRNEGIPLYYDYGEWGLICDDKDPEWHFDNKERSWVTAICRELNYNGFDDIFTAPFFQVKNYHTAWAFPECQEDTPNLMSQCPPQMTEKKCEKSSYFIRCSRTYMTDPDAI